MGATTVYRLTVTPAAWSPERGWHGGEPAVTDYATERELRTALVQEHGLPVGTARHAQRHSYHGWSWAWGPVEVPAAPLPKHVLKLALAVYRRMTEHYASHEEDCERDRRNGHTPHYCEHGTNRWTDYDNICGGCEDGYSLRDRLTRWQMAKEQAVERHAKAKAMLAWAQDAGKYGMNSNAFVQATIVRYEQMMEV